MKLTKCHLDNEIATHKCAVCGNSICLKHAGAATVCSSCISRSERKFSIKEKEEEHSMNIEELSRIFWGETEQIMFEMTLDVHKLPGYIAESEEDFIGFVAFETLEENMLIAALAVLPEFQRAGVGRALVHKVEEKARKLSKKNLLVSTSNDDLPALAFYQKIGFQIFAVERDVIKEKHERIILGFDLIPIRDEIKLRKSLAH